MENFVSLSLETHLFFERIMKEHTFFLEAGFPCKDKTWIEREVCKNGIRGRGGSRCGRTCYVLDDDAGG